MFEKLCILLIILYYRLTLNIQTEVCIYRARGSICSRDDFNECGRYPFFKSALILLLSYHAFNINRIRRQE